MASPNPLRKRSESSCHSLATWIVDRFGGDDAKQAVSDYVEELVSKCGAISPPVRLAKVAERIGVNPNPIYKPNVTEGALKIVDGCIRIVLRNNSKTPPPPNSPRFRRMRFTYAHELGHTLFYDLDARPQTRVAPEGNYRFEEQLCNRAASRFLIPNFMLQKELAGVYELSPELLCALSNEFQTSVQTMAYRIAESVPDNLEADQIYILSTNAAGIRGLGVEKPRCLACLVPKQLSAQGLSFLHSFQGIDRIKQNSKTADSPWSLEEYFHKSLNRRIGEELATHETLRCPDGHVVQLSAVHKTIGDGPLVWTTGRIRILKPASSPKPLGSGTGNPLYYCHQNRK